MKIKRFDVYTIVGAFLIAITVLGKIGSIYGTDFIAQVSEAMWVIIAVLLIAANQGRIIVPMRMRIMLFIAVVLFLVEKLNSISNNYQQPGLYRNLVEVSIVYWVIFTLLIRDCDKILILMKTYTTVAVVLAACSILASGISFDEWMNSEVYLFGGLGEKNALGQIFGTTILLEFFGENSKNNFKTWILKGIKIVILFAGLLFVQCRTAIIALGILWIIYLILNKEHRMIKIVGTGSVILLANIFNLTDIVAKSLFLDKYAGQGVSAFTSGRLDLWSEAIKSFSENILLGCGNYYVDNAYINALVNYGLFFGLLYICVILYNISKNLINSKYAEQSSLVIMATIFMLIVTFFEAIPPFGPGVSVLGFWLISAYVDVSKGEVL